MMSATTYAYKVRDRGGKILEGTLDGDSQNAIVGRLREMGYTPLQIVERKEALGKKEITLPWKKGIKSKEVAVMSRQFATMINSGLSLLRALNILSEQTENTRFAAILADVRADVEKGQSLSVAMAKHPKAFGRLYISMIRAGETGGVLDQTLLKLAETLEKEVELRHKIKSAMTYPVVVACLVAVIFSAMLLFVVPTFKNLYKDLGGVLPLPTRILIGASDIAKKYFLIWLTLASTAIWLLKRFKKTDAGRAKWDALKLKLPIFGKLVHKTALSRYSRTLSSLMRSGVPILQALDIVKETVNNTVVANAVTEVQTAVKEGSSMTKPLERSEVFPAMVVQMMAVGEETGALDTMLDKIADFYDQEIDATVSALTSLIEPLLIVIMGGGVGAMVVALYMPMFQIINLVK
jgi:type IV pilus assembly protein PilC